MPFKSDKQRRYLWSQKPEVAKKFAEHANAGKWIGFGGGDDLAAANLKRIKEQKKLSATPAMKTVAEKRADWLAANKYKRGAQMPAELRKKPELSDLKEPVDMITDFVPGVGEAKDVARAVGNASRGNYGAAAIDAAAAVAGVVPGIGDLAAKGIRNFHGFERARQRVPDLVPDDPQVWNKINDDVFHGRNLKLGPEAKRGGSASGKSSKAYNASVTTPDGKELPVLVAPHAHKKGKYHLITTRDRGRKNNDTSVLGGRHYQSGGNVGGK